MPPQATGFRYTPPSYLLRTRDENREGGDSSSNSNDQNELEQHLDMAMKQEDRPIRKETSVDQHFQHRVNRRKQMYRKIIQGEVQSDADTDKPGVDTENVDLHLEEGGDSATPQAKTTMAAREARQRRLNASTPSAIAAGSTTTILSKVQAEKTRVRNLRAQRLRRSLKTTTEEEDAMEGLKIRRQQQAETNKRAADREVAVRKQEEEAQQEAALQRSALEEERRNLELEREEFEQAKRRAAVEMERRAAMDMERRELEQQKQRNAATTNVRSSEACSVTSSASSRRRVRRDPELAETSFLDEFGDMFRDSGVLKVCVSSCFGEEDGVYEDGDDIKQSRPYRRKSNEEF
jgi:hypothetical protein